MSTTCKCVTTVQIFPSTYAVKTTRDIRFFTAFQGHDRNFHRITGTCIRGRETINRIQLTVYCVAFSMHVPLMLWWSCKYSCKKSKTPQIGPSTKSMIKNMHIVLYYFLYRIYTWLHLVGKPYDFNVVTSLMDQSQTVRPL